MATLSEAVQRTSNSSLIMFGRSFGASREQR